MHKTSMKFRLAMYRRQAGMTQLEVAEHLGVSQGLYNGLENGKRRMNEEYLEKLAALYGVNPVQLIVDEDRDDPLYRELDEAWRRLSPAERHIAVGAVKGIASSRQSSS